MEKSKKRPVVDEHEEGKQHVERLLKEENDAIKTFFFPEQVVVKDDRKRSKTSLQLKVPATEPTPFSKELEKNGGGVSINKLTGQVRKVTKGKNATKGRGVIQGNRVSTRPLPPALPHSSIGASKTADDDVDNLYLTEDNVDAPTTTRNDQTDSYIAAAAAVFDDGITPGKPVYTNDTWAETKVKSLQKQLSKQGKKVPDFFLRRNESPAEFTLDEQIISPLPSAVDGGSSFDDASGVNTNVDYALQPQATQWYSVERRCKLLTFNPDGDYKWPASSAYNCWNCCHSFSGPPCMIPRHFNRTYRFYEVYGNFCSWSCAKRFALDTRQEYHSENAPSIDFFAWKYFHVALPIPHLPPPFVLSTFSDFNMSIDQYRAIGKVHFVDKDGHVSPSMADNYTIVHPPCVPYELIIMWEVKHPQGVQLKKGFDPKKKAAFEDKMRGRTKIPDMPTPVVAAEKRSAALLSSSTSASKRASAATPTTSSIGGKKRKRDLLSIFEQQEPAK